MDRLLGELQLSADSGNNNLDNRTNVDMNGLLWSPDEFVIRQRGRRRASSHFSPDLSINGGNNVNGNHNPFLKTPTKMPPTTSMILRSSPRKRLTMGSTPEPSNESHHNISPMKTPICARLQLNWSDTPQIKKPRLNDMETNKSIAQQSNDIALETLLKGYSKAQLIQMVIESIQMHDDGTETDTKRKDREEQFRARLPTPNLDSYERQLQHAKRNIYKSLPTSRLCKKTDSAAYSRAAIHLSEFKRQLLEHLGELQESCHWDALLEYILIAWPIVRTTPIWDTASQNIWRRQCFKVLSSHCIMAIKGAGLRLGSNRLAELERNLQDWAKDYEDVLLCVSTLSKTLTKGRSSL